MGYIFSAISYGLFALAALLFLLAVVADTPEIACGAGIAYVITFIALFAGAGSLLSSRNDLDDEHKKKVTIGASLILGYNILIIIAYLLLYFGFEGGIQSEEGAKGLFIIFSLLVAGAFFMLGYGSFLVTQHLSKPHYFSPPKSSVKPLSITALCINGLLNLLVLVMAVMVVVDADINITPTEGEAFGYILFLVVILYFVIQMIPFIIISGGIIKHQVNEEGSSGAESVVAFMPPRGQVSFNSPEQPPASPPGSYEDLYGSEPPRQEPPYPPY